MPLLARRDRVAATARDLRRPALGARRKKFALAPHSDQDGLDVPHGRARSIQIPPGTHLRTEAVLMAYDPAMLAADLAAVRRHQAAMAAYAASLVEVAPAARRLDELGIPGAGGLSIWAPTLAVRRH